MTSPTQPDATPDSFADLPLQPTGSGVADLEIAYEQMKLTEGGEAGRADYDMESPVMEDEAAGEAHPS